MSVVYYWPTAFVKHWILPISYIMGMTYDGYIIRPEQQFFTADFLGGKISATAWFPEPVISVYAYSAYGGRYSDPIVVEFDYPAFGIFLNISIRP